MGSVQNSYLMWRQLSGEAKPTQGVQGSGLKAVNFQAPIHTGQTTSQALDGALNSLAGFAREYQNGVKREGAVADDKVKAWMRTKTVDEYRKLTREGNTPFQDDPLSMAALHRNSANALAFEVEEKIQNQIKQGAYKTPEDADKARIEALQGARSEWFLNGMADGKYEKAFDAGFGAQQDQRRNLTLALQQDVTDKAYRKEALIGVNTTMTAPVTAEFIAAGGAATVADYLTRTMEGHQQTGLLRSPEEINSAWSAAITNLQGIPGGSDVLAAMGDREVSIMGQKGKLRDFMGGGTFDLAVLKARDTENQVNTSRYGEFQKTVLDLVRNQDSTGVDLLIEQRVAESGGKTTNEIEALYRARSAIIEARDREIAKGMVKVQKDAEDFAAFTQTVDGINKYLAGGSVSNKFVDLGAKDEAMGRKAEMTVLDSYKDPVERLDVAIKLAGKFPNGFSSNVLEESKVSANAAMGQYMAQLKRGDTNAVLPESVTKMVNLYDRNPVAFESAFGTDNSYIDIHNATKETGFSFKNLMESKMAWDALPKDTKQLAEKELMGALGKVGNGYVSSSIKHMAGVIMSTGTPPEIAVEQAEKQFKKQHIEMKAGVSDVLIHKSFFTDDRTDSDVAQFSEGVFKDRVLPAMKKSAGITSGDFAVSFIPNMRSVRVVNLDTLHESMFSREQMLEESNKAAEEIRLMNNIKQTNEAAKLTKEMEAEKASRARGVFPQNQHVGSGSSGVHKNRSTK